MARKISVYSLFIALGIVAGYIDFILSAVLILPMGVKLGIANVIIVIALYFLGATHAFIISMVRILLSSFLFSGLNAMMYSLAGGILSFLAMLLFKQIKSFSIIGVSVIGAIFHNIGQVIVIMFVVQTWSMGYVLAMLVVSAVITGAFVGIVSQHTLKYLNKSNIKKL